MALSPEELQQIVDQVVERLSQYATRLSSAGPETSHATEVIVRAGHPHAIRYLGTGMPSPGCPTGGGTSSITYNLDCPTGGGKASPLREMDCPTGSGASPVANALVVSPQAETLLTDLVREGHPDGLDSIQRDVRRQVEAILQQHLDTARKSKGNAGQAGSQSGGSGSSGE